MPRARNHIMGGSYQNAFVRTPINNNMNRPNLSVGNMQSGMISTPRPRAKIPVLPAARPVTRIFQGGVMIRQTTPIPISSNLTPVSFIIFYIFMYFTNYLYNSTLCITDSILRNS